MILDQVANNNRAWYTIDRDYSGFFFRMTIEKRWKEKERDQDIGHMQTQIDLLTKRLVGGVLEKVKVMDTSTKNDKLEIDFNKKAMFF